MSSTSVRTVHYSVNRLTVEFAATPQEFRSRYEQAVPPLPVEQVKALMERQAPWQEMLELITATAPLGFLIYHQVHGDVMRLAGDKAFCVAYLMGNHTIAERMFRYEPAVLMYAPLRTAIWGDADGPAQFTFDKPSDQFRSFANPEITAVGVELDRKVAALLAHLGLDVPDVLLAS